MIEAASDAPSPKPILASPTSGQVFVGRLRFLVAMGVAATIFWHFGWWVAKPTDPAGAVSLLMIDQSVIAMAELLGLAVVVGGLATAICGEGSADRGPLAVAVGLATLAMRGGRMDVLVLTRMSEYADQVQHNTGAIYPEWSFIAETWLWLALIAVGYVVGHWVEDWFTAESDAPPAPRESVNAVADIRQAVGAIVVAFFVSWLTIRYAAGTLESPILKGQVCFAVIVAFMLGTLVAQWFFQTTSRPWSLVVVALVAMVSYLYAQPEIPSDVPAALYVPLQAGARPLPIEYAALGGIGVLIASDVLHMTSVMFGLNPPERERANSAA